MKILLVLVCMFFTSGVYAGRCVSNGHGDAACGGNGNGVHTTNRNNNAAVVQQNSNGVNHTRTRKGGEAYTKNGKGVVQGPGGTTCVRTANNRGCR